MRSDSARDGKTEYGCGGENNAPTQWTSPRSGIGSSQCHAIYGTPSKPKADLDFDFERRRADRWVILRDGFN